MLIPVNNYSVMTRLPDWDNVKIYIGYSKIFFSVYDVLLLSGTAEAQATLVGM